MTGRCPICGKTFEFDTIANVPAFPFCSERCRLVDLGRWIDGRYAIPASQPSSESDSDETESADDEESP